MAGGDAELTAQLNIAGIDEAIAGLQRLAAEGSAAFEKLSQAAEKVGQPVTRSSQQAQQALQRIEGAAARVSEAFGSVASSALNLGNTLVGVATKFTALFGVSLTAGLGGLALAFDKVVTGAASAGASILGLSKAFGTTAEEMSGLLKALGQFGIGADELGAAFRRLAVTVEREWASIKKEIAASADGAKQAILNIKTAQNQLEQSTINLQFLQAKQAAQSKSNDLAVIGSKLALRAAIFELRKLEGEPPSPEEQKQFDLDQARLRVKEARAALEEAERKRAQEDALQQAQMEAALLQIENERLAVKEKQRAAEERSRNDIGNLVKVIEDLAAGSKESFHTVETSAENLAKGIIASVGISAKEIGEFDGSLASLAGRAPQNAEVLFKVADVFKTIDDKSKATALAIELFGRNIGPKLVGPLSQGSAELKRQAAELEALGIAFTKADAEAGKKFEKTSAALGQLADDIKNKIGIQFAPIGTEIMEAISGRLKEGFPTIAAFFNALADQVIKPAAQAIINMIKGISFDDFKKQVGDAMSPEAVVKVGEWQTRFTAIKDGLVSAGESILKFFTVTLPAAIEITMGILNGLAELINKVFGKPVVTGDQLGLGLLLGQITGVNGAVLGLVDSIGSLVIALGALGLAAAGGGAAAAGGAAAGGTAAAAGILAPLVLALGAATLASFVFKDELDANLKAAKESLKRFSEGDTKGGAEKLVEAMFGPDPLGDLKRFFQRDAEITEAAHQLLHGDFKKFWELWSGGTKKAADEAAKSTEDGAAAMAAAADKPKTAWENFVDSFQKSMEKYKATVAGAKDQKVDVNLGEVAVTATKELGTAADETKTKFQRLLETTDKFGKTPLSPGSKAVLIDVQKMLDQINADLEKAGKSFPLGPRGPEVIGAGPSGAVPLPKPRPSEEIEKSTKALEQQKSAVEDVTKAVEDNVSAFDKTGDASENFAEQLSRIKPLKESDLVEPGMIDRFKTAFESIGTIIKNIFTVGGAQAAEAPGGGGGGGLADQILKPLEEIPNKIATIVDQINQKFTESASKITEAYSGVGGTFDQLASTIENAMARAVAAVQRLIDKANEAKTASSGAFAQGDAGGGGDIFAGQHGGLLPGREGTDVNLGLFSKDEYLMPVHAVRYWGVGFMDMVRRMRKLDLASLFDQPRRFDMGGLVGSMSRSLPAPAPVLSPKVAVSVKVPAYAGGGQTDRRVAVDFKLGGQLIGTVHTSEQTAKHLERLSSHAKIVATGSPPNWRR